MILIALVLACAAPVDDTVFKSQLDGWQIAAPPGWHFTVRNDENDVDGVIEINATKPLTKGNVVVAEHKGSTLAALKTALDAQCRADGAHAVHAPSIKGARLSAELTVDYGGVRGRTYVVDVAGRSAIVEITVPGAGPAADYAELKKAVDALADSVAFVEPGEKPWAHKKNVENLKAKLCSSKTAALTFDGNGHLVVDPGEHKSWYDLVGDDAKLALPGKAGPLGTVEVPCLATSRSDAGAVLELLCGKTKWRADLCAP